MYPITAPYRITALFSLLSLLLANSTLVDAQTLEYFGGVQQNRFFDFRKEEIFQGAEYEPEFGFHIGIGINSLKDARMTFHYELVYQNVRGTVNTFTGNRGITHFYDAMINTHQLNFRVYPLNIDVAQSGLWFRTGVQVGALITESTSGVHEVFN